MWLCSMQYSEMSSDPLTKWYFSRAHTSLFEDFSWAPATGSIWLEEAADVQIIPALSPKILLFAG